MIGMNDLYPPPPSDPPAWEDIERLSLHYPVLHRVVALVQRGDLTKEQALILAVFALADAFQKLFKAEIDRAVRTLPRPFVIPE